MSVHLQEICNPSIRKVREELLPFVDPANEEPVDPNTQVTFFLLDYVSQAVLGDEVAHLDRSSCMICLLMYYLIKEQKAEGLTFEIKSLPKPFEHIVLEISEGKDKVYCDPFLFPEAYEPDILKEKIRSTGVKLIKVAEQEKKLLHDYDDELIHEEQHVLRHYLHRLEAFKDCLDKDENASLKKDIRDISKRIEKRRKEQGHIESKNDKQIHAMQERLLSGPMRLRKRKAIAIDEQADYQQGFEAHLVAAVQQKLMQQFIILE